MKLISKGTKGTRCDTDLEANWDSFDNNVIHLDKGFMGLMIKNDNRNKSQKS